MLGVAKSSVFRHGGCGSKRLGTPALGPSSNEGPDAYSFPRQNVAGCDGILRRICTTSAKRICSVRSDIRVEQCSILSDILSPKIALIQLIGYFGGEI